MSTLIYVRSLHIILFIFFVSVSLAYVEGKEVTHDEWIKIVNMSYLPIALIEEMFGEMLNFCVALFQIPHQSLTRAELLRDLSIIGYTMTK